MEMTKGEICREYRTSKNKGKQIKILAQLNCCSVKDIREILIEGGEQLRGVPKENEEAKTLDSECEVPKAVVEVPKAVVEAVKVYYYKVDQAMKQVLNEIEVLNDRLSKMDFEAREIEKWLEREHVNM